MGTHDDDDDSGPFQTEEVERRREPRGVFPGLTIDLIAPKKAAFPAVEASRRGFFVPVADPEAFTLGDVHEAKISIGPRACLCRLEVFRKEIQPRRGIALRIAHIDPPNEEKLKAMLGPAGVG
jgi:hypothetical protein